MKKWILGAFLVLLINGANAQASLGFATYATPGLSDTVIKNSTVTYGVTVMNTGNQPVAGDFNVNIAVLDTALMFPVVFDSVTVTSNSLQPGDSLLVTITHLIDQLYFMDGNNTVVIWPASPNYITTDTIFKDVFVVDFQEIDELSDNQLIVFPNPATNYIFIRSDFKLEKVRIFDLNGKLIYSSSHSIIDLNNFENGLYVLELKTDTGKIITKKIMVSR